MPLSLYWIPVALIAVYQAAMVSALLYLDSSAHRWLPSVFAIAALLVPFIGYMAAAYHAPWVSGSTGA